MFMASSLRGDVQEVIQNFHMFYLKWLFMGKFIHVKFIRPEGCCHRAVSWKSLFQTCVVHQ